MINVSICLLAICANHVFALREHLLLLHGKSFLLQNIHIRYDIIVFKRRVQRYFTGCLLDLPNY